jgi:pimeloyl-ACP methyl ester carboxylesterase
MTMHRKTMRIILCLIIGCLFFVPVNAETPQELADPDGQFLDIDGVSIYIQARGDAANPAVILLHGFGGSTFTWRGTLDPLVEAGYYVIAMDLPPFGLSDKSAELDYSRTGLANIVIGVMDELEVETAVIVGHSMGGEVTASIGVYHPERVNALIFVSGGVFNDLAEFESTQEPDSSGDGLSDLSTLMADLDPKSPLAAVLVRSFLTPQRFTDLLESAYAHKEVITPEVIAGYQRPLLTEDWPEGLLAFSAADRPSFTLDDLAVNVTRYQIPVLIVWGQSDPWVNPALGTVMYETLYKAQLITYAGVGHLPMEEDPQAFNADVITFLQTMDE